MTNNVQLIIPATGFGSRFKEAGIKTSKPLISPDNQSFISHVFSMYSEIQDPLVVLNQDDPQIDLICIEIAKLKPSAQIVKIKGHKLGPAYTLWQVRKLIKKKSKIIVNYIDFFACWEWKSMLEQLSTFDGSILTYTGFHPHMLRNVKFAYVQLNAEKQVCAIREKESFTDDHQNELASAGTYGFSSGRKLIKALEYQIKQNKKINGEFYISLTYQYFLKKNYKIGVVNAEHFFQWGTPEDLMDWRDWLHLFTRINQGPTPTNQVTLSGSAIILAAGEGRRMLNVTNYAKPLTIIKGKPLWEYSLDAIRDLPNQYIAKKSSIKLSNKDNTLVEIAIDSPTPGQADTALQALQKLPVDQQGPITFLSCDNLIFQEDIEYAHENLRENDLIVWAKKGYLPSQISPKEYSWIHSKDDQCEVFIKSAPPDLNNAYMIIGNFTFKDITLARSLISKYLNLKSPFKESYLDYVVDTAIKSGKKVKILEVKNFFAIGTQNEYNLFKYWENCRNFNSLSEDKHK